MIAALWSVCGPPLSLCAEPPAAMQYTEPIRAQMSCGMAITSFRPQTPAILPIPSAVLEGISKTGRFVPLTFWIRGSPVSNLCYPKKVTLPLPRLF